LLLCGMACPINVSSRFGERVAWRAAAAAGFFLARPPPLLLLLETTSSRD
jgi:hypothetical protein